MPSSVDTNFLSYQINHLISVKHFLSTQGSVEHIGLVNCCAKIKRISGFYNSDELMLTLECMVFTATSIQTQQ